MFVDTVYIPITLNTLREALVTMIHTYNSEHIKRGIGYYGNISLITSTSGQFSSTRSANENKST